MMLSVGQYILFTIYIFHLAHLNLDIYDTRIYFYCYLFFIFALFANSTLLFL